MANVATARSLDLLERFHLAQARAGSIPYITIIGLMIVSHADFSQILAQITRNVNQLMQLHPILVARIDDSDIRRPRWIPNDENPPFVTHDPMVHPIIGPEVDPVQCVTQVAEAEDAEAQGFTANGPLWRVGIYHLTQQPLDGYYIALTVHHVVSDGIGALRLFEEVMWQPSAVPTTSSRPRPQPMPPKAQKTLRMQPSVAKIVRRGARWILRQQKSPGKIMRGLGAMTKWPPPQLLKQQPRKPDVSHAAVNFGKDQNRIAERLEALGHQIGSVHSVLHTAAVVALAAAVSKGIDEDTFDTISTETPMSLRRQGRHPTIGGHYMGLTERSIPLSSLGSETIASFTRNMNRYMHSPQAESDARSRVGEFRLMPDRLIPDLWKALLTKKGTSNDPYRNSLMISNLGRFETRHIPGLNKVWFCHASMPWGAAINMDVVSLTLKKACDVSGRRDSRLTVMISWLDSAIERKVIDRFVAALVRVVNLMARAGGAPNLDRHVMRTKNLQDLAD